MSPIFTMPCGWCVGKAIGISATGCQRTLRVSFWTRSATRSFAMTKLETSNAAIPTRRFMMPPYRYNAPAPI